jgi:hypothetical protein
LEEHAQPRLQPARVVLQRQIEDLALLDLDLAEGEAAGGDRDSEAETEPTLADLRSSTLEGEPFSDEVVDCAARLR